MTRAPFASELAAFSPSWPQHTTSKNDTCSCHSLLTWSAAVDGDAELGDGLAAGGEAKLGVAGDVADER